MSSRITADVIEANEFQTLSERFNVMGVPKTVVNEQYEFTGALPERQAMQAIRQAIGAPKEAGE